MKNEEIGLVLLFGFLLGRRVAKNNTKPAVSCATCKPGYQKPAAGTYQKPQLIIPGNYKKKPAKMTSPLKTITVG